MTDVPSLGEVLGPLLARVSPERQPLFIALAERMAAARYREWATRAVDDARSAELRRCAEREEEIARRVEALMPDAAAIQRALRADFPDLDAVNQSIFAGRPLTEQLAIQAKGERLGAATWRAFAKRTAEPGARETFLACAELEEASAMVLESILGDQGR